MPPPTHANFCELWHQAYACTTTHYKAYIFMYQVATICSNSIKVNLNNRCKVSSGNFLKMPFLDASFNNVYSIKVANRCSNKLKISPTIVMRSKTATSLRCLLLTSLLTMLTRLRPLVTLSTSRMTIVKFFKSSSPEHPACPKSGLILLIT